jgi:hypothetical protein
MKRTDDNRWRAFFGLAACLACLWGLGTGPARAQDRPVPAVVDTQAVAATSVPPAELRSLADKYNRWAAGLRTVKGGGRARVGAEGEKSRVFDFSLVLARPSHARIQGRWGSLATLFDLSGDASGWTLYLPRDRAVVRTTTGEASAGLLLPPAEIISVLLPAGIPPADLLRRGAASREGDGEVRLVVPPGRGGAGSPFHRVLVVDAADGKPRRLEVRRTSQLETPILVADYEEYEGKGADAFPVKVRVDLPESGQWTRFNFHLIRINTGADLKLFDLRVPPGTRVLSPEELTPEFLPEAEDDGTR